MTLAGLLLMSQSTGQVPRPPFDAPEVVKEVKIDPRTPVLVPVHPRIATTVSFPKPIGEPMGTGFVEADLAHKAAAEGKPVGSQGEYLISFTQGDTYFSVQPRENSDLLNLNVPYEGSTVVLYFHRVEHPLSAVASLRFVEQTNSFRPPPSERSAHTEDPSSPDRTQRREELPPLGGLTASPARLEGLLRKMKAIHAAKPGPELEDLASAMKLKVQLSAVEDMGSPIVQPVSDAGRFQLILLRVVRDPLLDAIGFVLLFRSTSSDELVFDLRTLSARCGEALYTARVIDAPAVLRPGEMKAGYFIVVGSGEDRPGYLSPGNPWRLSVRLLGPPNSAGDSIVEAEGMAAAP